MATHWAQISHKTNAQIYVLFLVHNYYDAMWIYAEFYLCVTDAIDATQAPA